MRLVYFHLSPTFQLVQWITNAGSPLLLILPVVHFVVLVRLTAHALTVLLPNKRGKKTEQHEGNGEKSMLEGVNRTQPYVSHILHFDLLR